MNRIKLRASSLSFVALAAAGLLSLGAPAWADDPGRNVCDGVHQDLAACRREQGAAREEAKRGNLPTADAATLRQNAMDRCKLQPPADQRDCIARITGRGDTTVSGSVLGGGDIRETVTPIPAPR
jgi:hypothetical protein